MSNSLEFVKSQNWQHQEHTIKAMVAAIDYMRLLYWNTVVNTTTSVEEVKKAILEKMPNYRPSHAITALRVKGLIVVEDKRLIDFSGLIDRMRAYQDENKVYQDEKGLVLATYTPKMLAELAQLALEGIDTGKLLPTFSVGSKEISSSLAKGLVNELGYKLEVSTDG